MVKEFRVLKIRSEALQDNLNAQRGLRDSCLAAGAQDR
jgi:hypothetical protein